MLLSKIITPLALAATVLADGAAINTALQTIDKDINALTSSLKSFSGDIFGALPILFATTTLKNAIDQGTKVANSSQALSSDDTVGLANTVGTIITDATASIDAFIADKPAFDKLLIVSPIAVGLVKGLKTATSSLGDAIIAKVPADFKDVATQLVGQINDQFDRGIAAYSNGTGGSAFPGFPSGGSGIPRARRSSRVDRHQ